MKNRVLYRAMVCLLVLVTTCSAAFILVEVRKGEEGEEQQLDCPEVYPEAALEDISASEVERKVNALLAAMTEEEMYAMLGGSHSEASARGYGTGYVGGVPRLGVPVLRLWDGPKGVIGDGNMITTSPASELALAASFSEDLAYRYGQMTGRENRATGGNVQLGVQIDNVRAPFFTRGRDSLGEDSYLTSVLGDALSAGVESQHVISTLKHFAGYSSQFDSQDSVDVDEQTLFEVYLAPFEYILKRGHASAVMASYNKLNGVQISENAWLLKTVLRDMWGFDGIATVDWGANHTLTTHLGIDLEMSTIEKNSRENIEAAITSGSMTYEDVVTAVRHVLTAMGEAGYLGLVQVKEDGTAAEDPDPAASIELEALEGEKRRSLLEEDDAVAVESAVEGAVLLKNQGDALPLSREDDIAMIGLLAEHTLNYYSESSYGWLEKMTGAYKSMREILGEDADITAQTGLDVIGEPIPGEYLYTSEDCRTPGVVVTKGTEEFREEMMRITVGTRDGKANRTWKNAEDGNGLKYGEQMTMTAYLKAPETGIYELQLLKIGGTVGATLETDEEISISGSGTNVRWPSTGVIPTDEGMDIPRETTTVHLQKDAVYKITIEASAESGTKDLQLSLNWFRPGQRQALYDAALNAARTHQKIVYFAYDMGSGDSSNTDRAARKNRATLELAEDQKELLEDIIEIAKEENHQVIVVLNTALPISMEWLDGVDAVLEMWLSGQSGGEATARLMTGLENPSGKLPVTFPKGRNDTQFGDYEANYNREKVNTIDWEKGGEGIFYGYRWYDREGIEPLFPFGYGLSYTEFTYSGLKIEKEPDGYLVTFTVENAGETTGTEIAQVYLGAAQAPEGVQMADYALAAFVRLEDIEPGESRTVTAKVEARQLCYWDAGRTAGEGEEKWTLAEGERIFYVGSSSDQLLLSERVDVKDIDIS